MKPTLLGCLLAGLLLSPTFAQWAASPQPDLAALLAKAQPLNVETLDAPVNSIRLGMTLWAPNPDGKSHDLLQIYFPRYGGPNHIVVHDFGSGQTKRIDTGNALNFHLCPSVIANEKLYISILDNRLRQQVCIYDPATNELAIKALALPETLLGETHPMVLGTDGMIYMAGAHPTKAASAVQIDPKTGKVTDLGPIGPSHEPAGCWGYSAGADDRYVYIASGKVPWYLVAYDRQTGKAEALVTTEKVDGYVSVSQGPDGVTGSATKVVGTDGSRIDYWLHEGKAIVKKSRNEAPPWPRKAAGVVGARKPEVSLAQAVPDAQGNGKFLVRDGSEWKPIPFQVPIYPQETYRLMELPDGRLFGTAGAYERNFVHDPKTGKSEHLGKSDLSHYATAIVDGKVYMSGYPSSPLYVYDPAKPWTAGTGLPDGRVLADDDARSNPRRLLNMKEAGTHKMYAAAVGADGRVYFGGQWMRNGSAGGLGWFDPKSGAAGGFWEVFSNYQIGHMTAAGDGRFIVISTHRVSDTLLNKPKPEQGKLFIFDTQEGKIVRDVEPVMQAKGSGLVVGVGGSRVLGWTENPADPKSSILYGIDAANGTVEFRKVIPAPLPVGNGSNQQEPFDYRVGPDGKVWTFIGGTLVTIDPKDAAITPIGKIDRGGRLAFSSGFVYLSGRAELRRFVGKF